MSVVTRMSESVGLVAIAVTVLVMPSYRTEAVAASVEYSIRVLTKSRSKRERNRERKRESQRE